MYPSPTPPQPHRAADHSLSTHCIVAGCHAGWKTSPQTGGINQHSVLCLPPSHPPCPSCCKCTSTPPPPPPTTTTTPTTQSSWSFTVSTMYCSRMSYWLKDFTKQSGGINQHSIYSTHAAPFLWLMLVQYRYYSSPNRLMALVSIQF